MNTEAIPARPNTSRGILRGIATGLNAYVSTMGALLIAGSLAHWHELMPPDTTFGEFWGAVAPLALPGVVLAVLVRWVLRGRWAR